MFTFSLSLLEMDLIEVNSSVQFLTTFVEKGDFKNLTEVTDNLRILRKACVNNSSIQNYICDSDGLLPCAKKLLRIVFECENETSKLCSVVGLQFLANLTVMNPGNQLKVWSSCCDVIYSGLVHDVPKIRTICAMIMYHVFLGSPGIADNLSTPHEQLFDLAMNEDTSEFALYTCNLLVLKHGYVEKFYTELKLEHKLVLLEIIKQMVSEDSELSEVTVKFLINYFTKNADSILNTVVSEVDSLKPTEVLKLLDVIVALSSNNESVRLKYVQDCKSLLINTLFLLKAVHELSKESGNNFSMIQKVEDLLKLEKEEKKIEEHPGFGFKCSLVRLVGNMCWRHCVNQRLTGDTEGIPLLLDCCNIDGRNPFIIQWVVLAVRNLCENNPDNQRVIATMCRRGDIDTSVVQKLGITLNSSENGDTVSIVPIVKKS